MPRIFDGHNDVLSQARSGPTARPVPRRATATATSTCRGRARGGLGGRLLRRLHRASPPRPTYASGAYYAPSTSGGRCAEALAQVALLLRLERESGGGLRWRAAAADLDGDGFAAVLHLEGAEPIGPRLDELRGARTPPGMRSLGLVWSRPNAFATGVPFAFPGSPDQGPG